MKPLLAVLLLMVGSPAWGAEGIGLLQAVEASLQAHPDLDQARQDIALGRADLTAAAAPFDWNVGALGGYEDDAAPPFPGGSVLRIQRTFGQLGLAKRFRFGTSIEPAVRLWRVRGEDVDSSSSIGLQNNARVGLTISQPLLEGAGDVASAEEDAARLLARAAEQEFRHALAFRVLSVTGAYWRYVAAHRVVEVLETAEVRATKLLTDTQALVDADQRPAAELGQVKASLADWVRARVEAERAVLETRHRLGLEMGQDLTAVAALGAPATPFPAKVEGALSTPAMVEAAVSGRADLQASRHREEASARMLASAEDGRLPNLDVVGNLGYSSRAFGGSPVKYFAALSEDVLGLNGSLSLSLDLPISNAAADGAAERAMALKRAAAIERAQFEREIPAEVQMAVWRLEKSAESLARAQEAARLYETSVANERTKLSVGLSTLIDVILTEDRLTEALIAEIVAESAYASALAMLRFQTGTIVTVAGEAGEVRLEQLTTPPKVSTGG